eukprot:gene8553-biopygen8678
MLNTEDKLISLMSKCIGISRAYRVGIVSYCQVVDDREVTNFPLLAMADIIHGFPDAPPGEVTVGSKIEVFWKDDDCFYPGVVKEFNEDGKAHVLYDGDEETLDLSKENFKIINSSGVSELTDETADADGENIDCGGDDEENKRGGVVERPDTGTSLSRQHVHCGDSEFFVVLLKEKGRRHHLFVEDRVYQAADGVVADEVSQQWLNDFDKNRGKAMLSLTSKNAASSEARVVKDHRDQRW